MRKKDKRGRLIEVIRKVIFGKIDNISKIDIVNLENYNNILRESISRLVRDTLSYSKCIRMLENHLDIYQAYNNLVKTYPSLNEGKEKKTPCCMAEGLTKHIWSWRELLVYNYHQIEISTIK